MIKAEVITHEGVPAPNWLDHCRTMITPGTITSLVVIVAAAAVVSGILHHHSAPTTPTSSSTTQQANTTPLRGLEVEPAANQINTDSSGDTLLQPAPTPATDNTDSQLGAPVTPSLGGGSASNTYQQSATTQNQFSGQRLLSVPSSLQKSLNAIKKTVTKKSTATKKAN